MLNGLQISERTYITILNDESVVYAGFQHFEHLSILHIVTYVFKNIAIRNNTKGSKDHPDRDIGSNIRDSGFYYISRLNYDCIRTTVWSVIIA